MKFKKIIFIVLTLTLLWIGQVEGQAHRYTVQEILNMALDTTISVRQYTEKEIFNMVFDTTNQALKVDIDSFLYAHIDSLNADTILVDYIDISGNIIGDNADTKLVRATDSTYAMTGTDWQIIDDWDWSSCYLRAYNMIVDSNYYNVECESGYGGKYVIHGFITLSVDANSQNIYVGIGKNGNNPGTFAQANTETKSAGEISNVVFVNSPILSAGDSLSIYIKNSDGGQNITVGRSNFIFELLHQE